MSVLDALAEGWNNYIGSTLFGQLTSTGNTDWNSNPALPSIDIAGIVQFWLPIIIPILIIGVLLILAYIFIRKFAWNWIKEVLDIG